MVTRDSAVWWLGIGGAFVTYLLSVNLSPQQWDYHQWLQFAAMIIATISGKLATSPLQGAKDVATVPVPRP